MESWHSEYLDMMFGKNRTIETMNRAAELKYHHMPEALFKFRCFCDTHLSALQNDCLFSSSPDYLNDIREAPLTIITERIKRESLQHAYDEARKKDPRLPEVAVKDENDIAMIFRSLYFQRGHGMEPEWLYPGQDTFITSIISWLQSKASDLVYQEQKILRNTYNICCFSSTIHEDLLWAHYSDGHKGFCIQYNFKKLGLMDDNVQLLFPVIYQAAPHITIEDLDSADGSLLMYALTLKSDRWQYEKEWRRFYLHTDKPNPEALPKPEAIYLGVNCSKENRDKMLAICKDKCLPLFQMRLSNITSPLNSERIL